MKAANSLRKISARKQPVVARTVVDQAQGVKLSERDSLRVLDLLENLPAPNARIMAAVLALPDPTESKLWKFSRMNKPCQLSKMSNATPGGMRTHYVQAGLGSGDHNVENVWR